MLWRLMPLLVLLLEETGVLGENHWPAAGHWQALSRNVVLSGIGTHNVCDDMHLMHR